jgi:hypothetical protein
MVFCRQKDSLGRDNLQIPPAKTLEKTDNFRFEHRLETLIALKFY